MYKGDRYLPAVVALLLLGPAVAVAETRLSAGTLLVAEESISDPSFAETVILLIDVEAGGSIGLVVNRPAARTVADAIDGLPSAAGTTLPLFIGGPVQPARFSLLSRKATGGGRRVVDGVYFSRQIGVLRQLLDSGGGLADLRVFAGHSAWLPNQLEMELLQGEWCVLSGRATEVFRPQPEQLWSELYPRCRQQWVNWSSGR